MTRKKLTIDFFKNIAEEKQGVLISSNYVNSHEKMIWKCKEGHKFKSSGNAVKQGRWCALCSRNNKRVNLKDKDIKYLIYLFKKRKFYYKTDAINSLKISLDILNELLKRKVSRKSISKYLNINLNHLNTYLETKYNQEYRDKNKEKIRAYNKEYYEKYYQENKEIILKQQQEYHKKN